MGKLWKGRTDAVTEQIADDFNSSIRVDQRMYREDIKGSMAHASMLAATGIITKQDADEILGGLEKILNDIESGALAIDENSEDIHTFVEQTLTERIGEAGKKLHTARSRNDQVVLDLRLYLKEETAIIIEKLKSLIYAVTDKAEEYKSVVTAGYTHLQRAQPVSFGHHLLAYAFMF